MLIRIASVLLVIVLATFAWMLMTMQERGEQAPAAPPVQGSLQGPSQGSSQMQTQRGPAQMIAGTRGESAGKMAALPKPEPATALAPAPASAPAHVGPAPVQAAAASVTVETVRLVRDVGGGVVPVPVALSPGAEIERMAVPEPKPEPQQVATSVPSMEALKPVLLFRPVVAAAGVIVAEGRTISLQGIAPVAADRLCQKADGSRWPCGMMARTALRQFVRGRAVACVLPDQQLENVHAACSVGGQDIAEWLIEQGWADAETGSPLARLSEAARAMGRGIHARG